MSAQGGGCAHAELARAEQPRRSFFLPGQCSRPTESAAIGEAMQRRSVIRSIGFTGCEHMHFVSRAEQLLHFTLNEVTCRVSVLARIRSRDDGDAFAQVRGSSPSAFTASAPCSASISPSTRR